MRPPANRCVKAVGIAICIVVVVGVAAVACFIGAVWFDIHWAKPHVRITKAQVESEVRHNLSVGSSRKQVEAFLSSRGIEHSYVPELLDGSEYSNAEMGLIRDTAHTWLIRTDIELVFTFDAKGQVSKIVVKEINTGP